jgi:hypothetical protein
MLLRESGTPPGRLTPARARTTTSRTRGKADAHKAASRELLREELKELGIVPPAEGEQQ